MSLISDLGEVALEDVTAQKAFNWQWTVGKDNTFIADPPVKRNHTYAVLNTKSDVRALFAIKFLDISDEGKAKVEFAVLSYTLTYRESPLWAVQEAPGFSWTEGNKRCN